MTGCITCREMRCPLYITGLLYRISVPSSKAAVACLLAEGSLVNSLVSLRLQEIVLKNCRLQNCRVCIKIIATSLQLCCQTTIHPGYLLEEKRRRCPVQCMVDNYSTSHRTTTRLASTVVSLGLYTTVIVYMRSVIWGYL